MFCAAPNARQPTAQSDAGCPTVRTYLAQANVDRNYFEEGRAWAVYYIGGGLHAGLFARERDLRSTF